MTDQYLRRAAANRTTYFDFVILFFVFAREQLLLNMQVPIIFYVIKRSEFTRGPRDIL